MVNCWATRCLQAGSVLVLMLVAMAKPTSGIITGYASEHRETRGTSINKFVRHSGTANEKFGAVARKVIKILAEGNARALQNMVSDEGLVAVIRYVDWKSKYYKNHYPKEYKEYDNPLYYLLLKGARILVWVDITDYFSKKELTEKRFGVFLKLIKQNVNLPPFKPRWSYQMWDHWHTRIMGPAIEEKICSNTYWYVCLLREHGRWVVGRIEFVMH